MEEKDLRIWFDREGDLLEIEPKKTFIDVGNDIFVRLNHEGNITGFIILNAIKRKTKMRWKASSKNNLFENKGIISTFSENI